MTEKEIIEKGYAEVKVFDKPSYDGCIIGVTTEGVAVYSFNKMVDWYCKENNCDSETAIEFIEYNTLRSLPYRENHPVVIDDL